MSASATERAKHPPLREIFQRSLQTKRHFPVGVPRPQAWLSHFDPDQQAWVRADAAETQEAFLVERAAGGALHGGKGDASLPAPEAVRDDEQRRIHVITWNIDFLTPWGKERMARALEYLGSDVVGPLMQKQDSAAAAAVVIMFQEMTAHDVELILDTEWVRRWFSVCDEGTDNWDTPLYGTLTLVSHALPITRIFRVPVESNMSRDGLFADVAFPLAGSSGEPTINLRFCNLHLESLIAKPPLRPAQLRLLSAYLHDPRFSGSVAAGDCNAIEPFDAELHADNGLQDAFLDSGGREGDEEGNTWGYQEKEERFPPGRLDKVFYVSSPEFTEEERDEDRAKTERPWTMQVERLEKIGVGIKVEGMVADWMQDWADLTFVTDHYGLLATFVLQSA